MRPARPGRSSASPDEADDADTGFDARLIWAGLFLSMATFAKLPVIDLWFSQRYHSADKGFFQQHNPMVQALQQVTVPVCAGVLLVAGLLALGAPWWARLAAAAGHDRLAGLLAGTWRRSAVMVVCVGALCSGVLVQWGLKGHIGRPTPAQTIEFGGAAPFQPVFSLGEDPTVHRSFPSAHAAAAFSLLSIGWWASPMWRRRWFLIGLVAGSLVGMARIMQGAHYLSDVVFSFYAVWLTCELVAFGLRRLDARRAAHAGP
ncbi:MAG: phosphatase PAP2 family protein [Rubrivivax sp.]|nr:MAG: phosphatase PAP2 family protein [Rubrivivax sp.]